MLSLQEPWYSFLLPHEKRSNLECGGAMRIGLSHRFCRATGLSLVGYLLAPYAADNFSFGATVDSSRTVGTTYTEDLSLERLGQHHVAAKFLFRSEWVPQDRHRCQDHEDWLGQKVGADATARREGEGKLCHFEAVFPREIGVLLDKFKVRDLSLQMSKGKWDTTAWGNGPDGGASGEFTAGGAEMWARLPSHGTWGSWVGLRRSLSGIYCSSLDAMDETKVYTPVVMAMPGEKAQALNETTVLRGTLPREPVCTENLTPLIKMLPCRSQTGLGRLLYPTRLFQSDYHSISVRASATFSDAAAITSVTLEQTVLAVFRPRPHLPSAVSRKRSRGLSDPDENEAHVNDEEEVTAVAGDNGWSMSSLLLPRSASGAARAEMTTLEGCPVASLSTIRVLDPSTARGISSESARCRVSDETCVTGASASGGAADGSTKEGESTIKDSRLLWSSTHGKSDDEGVGTGSSTRNSDWFREKLWQGSDNQAQQPAEATIVPENGSGEAKVGEPSSAPAVARLDHHLAGRGGTRGVSVSHLVNMHPTANAYVEFLQPVPYFMVPLLGTLRARLVPSCASSLGGTGPLPAAGGDSSCTGENAFVDTSSGGKRCSGTGEEAIGDEATGPLVNLARNLTLTPGEGRSPAVIEAQLWVPAASTLVLGFDFYKRFLTVDDFPPDPSRGLDVPAPLARFSFVEPEQEFGSEAAECALRNGVEGREASATQAGGGVTSEGKLGHGCKERVVYAYGEAGLLDTPQPDFSMPFNVITFTSTVITFFLGTAINLLVRKSASKKRGKGKRKKTDGGEGEEREGDAPSEDGVSEDGSLGARGWLDRPRRALSRVLGSRQRWQARGGVVSGSRKRDGPAGLKED